MMHQFDSDLSRAQWFKTIHSSAAKDCVEVAFLPSDSVGVRDSKNPDGPALVFGDSAWNAFTTALADGTFQEARGA